MEERLISQDEPEEIAGDVRVVVERIHSRPIHFTTAFLRLAKSELREANKYLRFCKKEWDLLVSQRNCF
jgi:hypothetical protein